VNFCWTFTSCVEKSYDGTHLAFGRDFGSALPFQTRLTQTKPVLPLSNKHGSQVEEEGWRQCCHNKHKKFPYRPTLLSGHASYYALNSQLFLQLQPILHGEKKLSELEKLPGAWRSENMLSTMVATATRCDSISTCSRQGYKEDIVRGLFFFQPPMGYKKKTNWYNIILLPKVQQGLTYFST